MTIAVTGYRGKLGSLLIKKPGFVSLPCDVTNPESISRSLDTLERNGFSITHILNLAAVSSIIQCEKDAVRASSVNTFGIYQLHQVFGKHVITVSSDQVFPGRGLFNWFLPKETSAVFPVNNYALTKIAGEAISQDEGGKIIRLSRTVAFEDEDISNYRAYIKAHKDIYVPSFFKRNYIAREQAVRGLEYFAKNYNTMPDIVHYGGLENVSMYELIHTLVPEVKQHFVHKRRKYLKEYRRPKYGGFNVNLAKSLGFPMFDLYQVLQTMRFGDLP